MSRQGCPRQGKVCRDRASLCRDIFGHGRENSCRDRELWVATELDVRRLMVRDRRPARATVYDRRPARATVRVTGA